MSALLVIQFQRDDQPAARVVLPLSVIRANPKLLPKFADETLKQHGIEPAELAQLTGVRGPVLEISRPGLKLRVAVQDAPGDGTSASAPPPSPPNAPPPAAAPAAPAPSARAPEEASTVAMGPMTQRQYQSRNLRLETEQIASELGWRTGHDLIFAACAYFTLNLKKPLFTREEIDAEIKRSAQFYKPFYSINLGEYLQYLIKARKLHQPQPGLYALTPEVLKYLEDRLSPERLRRRV